jgi:hypothetical protein
VADNTTLVRRRTGVSVHRLLHISAGLKPAGATFDLPIFKQASQVYDCGVGARYVRGHYQGMISDETEAATIQDNGAPQGILGWFQFPNNLLHAHPGIFLVEYIPEINFHRL